MEWKETKGWALFNDLGVLYFTVAETKQEAIGNMEYMTGMKLKASNSIPGGKVWPKRIRILYK